MRTVVRMGIGKVPGCRGWLVRRWTAMHPGASVIGTNELGLWHDDEAGSTHLCPWPEVLASVLEGIVQEEAVAVR